MKKILILIAVISLALMQLPLSAQVFSPNAEQQVLLNLADEKEYIRVIITYDLPFTAAGDDQPGLLNQQRAAIASATEQILERNRDVEFENVRTYNNLPHMAMTTNRQGLIALFNDPDVRDVQIDELSAPSMDVSNGIVGSPVIWDLGYTGEGMTVAVLDTGVDASHTHFGGRVVAEACFSSNVPSQGASTLCPDGTQEQIGAGAGDDCDTSTISGCGHGTHVAGTVAGSSMSSGRAIDGVAKDANIIAIQVFSEFDYQDPGEPCGGSATENCALAYTSDQIAGLNWLYDQRNDYTIVSANMSLGGGFNSSVCDGTQTSRKNAMDQLKTANIATVVASGNNGFKNALNAPACISTAISVGSTQTGKGGTTEDAVSGFSNSADFLDLLAPGHWIESAQPDGNYATFRGTSMAAPHVAGAWALYRQAFPDASVDDVLAAIADHGVLVTDDANGITTPRLQIDESMLNTQSVTQIPGTNQGWRMLGSPVPNTTYADMFNTIWTQGFPGSNGESATSNIYSYEEQNIQFYAPSDASQVIGTTPVTSEPIGRGVLVYVYENDNDGNPDPWPKPLNVTGVPNIGDVVLSLSRSGYASGADGFHIVSNPFPFTLDWADVHADADPTEIHAIAYVWDANKDGGADYIHTGAGGGWDGKIAPFQGFWVEAPVDAFDDPFPGSSTLTFKAGHKSDTEGDLYNEPVQPKLSFDLISENRQTTAGFVFDDEKSQEPELYNALRLASLSPSYLHLFSTSDASTRNFSTQYLPFSELTTIEIPLYVNTTESGNFTLKTNTIEQIDGLEIILVDHHTKSKVPVDEFFSYDFTITPDKNLKAEEQTNLSPLEWVAQLESVVHVNQDKSENRFSLIFNRISTNTGVDNELPTTFSLNQNYPNPFNPTTNIEFDLPESADVRLEVYNITGQRVAVLVNETVSAGSHTVSFDASRLSSGVYVYRIQAGSFNQTKKMTLVK